MVISLLGVFITQAKPIADNVRASQMVLNTNITASVVATAVSSSEIRLDMSATSTDGNPITGFIIYRDGVYLDTVKVLRPPGGIGVNPTP